jgi:hypothetical protein
MEVSFEWRRESGEDLDGGGGGRGEGAGMRRGPGSYRGSGRRDIEADVEEEQVCGVDPTVVGETAGEVPVVEPTAIGEAPTRGWWENDSS